MSDALMIAVISTIGLVVAATLPVVFKIWLDLREVHKTMNSRLDQLLESRGREERAKGVVEGEANRSRDGENR